MKHHEFRVEPGEEARGNRGLASQSWTEAEERPQASEDGSLCKEFERLSARQTPAQGSPERCEPLHIRRRLLRKRSCADERRGNRRAHYHDFVEDGVVGAERPQPAEWIGSAVS